MRRDYDSAIAAHYSAVAAHDGLSPDSTMADQRTRQIETDAIHAAFRVAKRPGDFAAVDVGCGNGYTLETLASAHPEARFVGIEHSPELRALAERRFAASRRAEIRAGDIRDAGFAGVETFDFLVCQRVLINLLDAGDQARALDNIVRAVRPGGVLVFIEAFQSALDLLNAARGEFDLAPIPPAHHNLNLADSFFDRPDLAPVISGGVPPSNFLSTHYFVSRVLHPLLLGDRKFKRNAEFTRFFSEALRPAVGDYSPLRLHVFRRAT
jgi:SAM-dependent methyltransferase